MPRINEPARPACCALRRLDQRGPRTRRDNEVSFENALPETAGLPDSSRMTRNPEANEGARVPGEPKIRFWGIPPTGTGALTSGGANGRGVPTRANGVRADAFGPSEVTSRAGFAGSASGAASRSLTLSVRCGGRQGRVRRAEARRRAKARPTFARGSASGGAGHTRGIPEYNRRSVGRRIILWRSPWTQGN